MTPRQRPSENQKLGCFLLLIPLLWPIVLAWMLCAATEAVVIWVRETWHRLKGKDRR
jgi:hypothetical protein